MLPALQAGTIVVALKRPARIVPGAVVIVRHEGIEKIKRVHAVDSTRVYLIGDNLAASTDSRTFGWLHRDAVLGRVWWPRS